MSNTRILLWNARGFENKKEEICNKMYKLKIDIGILTEVKCAESKTFRGNNNLSISGYNTVLVNNYKRRQVKAGGMAIFFRKEMEPQKIEVSEKAAMERCSTLI